MKRRAILSRTEILIFLIMFPIIKPGSLRTIAPLIETLFDLGRVISAFFALIIYVYTLRRKSHIKSSIWILISLEVWIIFTTVINNYDRLFDSIVNGIAIIVISMLVESFSQSDTKALLKALLANFEWLVYVNLITQIIFPKGLYQLRGHPCYFLGLDNSSFIYLLPAVIVSYLNHVCLGSKLRPFLLMTASTVSIIIGRCATSIVSLITFIIVFVFLNAKGRRERFKLLYIWIISIFFDLLISVFRIMDTFLPFRIIIINFLGKSTTLSGRTYVWDQALRYWARYPLIGNGYDTIISLGTSYVSHAHNAYLQYLLIGGIIGLIIFVAFNLLSISYFDASCGTSRSGKGFKAAFAVLFVTYITEACNYPLLFIIYALADCIPVFVTLEYGRGMN